MLLRMVSNFLMHAVIATLGGDVAARGHTEAICRSVTNINRMTNSYTLDGM